MFNLDATGPVNEREQSVSTQSPNTHTHIDIHTYTDKGTTTTLVDMS